MKPLPGIAITNQRLAAQVSNTWDVEIDPKQTPAEWLFNPGCWINVANMLKRGDLIRIHANDGSYDFLAVVRGRTTGGKLAARIAIYAGYGDGLPEYVKEAERNSVAEALMPTMFGGRPVPRVDHVDREGWRVIGFDNLVTSKGHETEAQAMRAMAEYIKVYGFKAPSAATVSVPAASELAASDIVEATDKVDRDLDVSFQKRKEVTMREKREEQRKADIAALEKRRLEIAAKNAQPNP